MVLMSTYPRYARLKITRGKKMDDLYNGSKGVHVLLQLEWSQPQIQGDSVSPRAGHAGVSINEKWFIVGGGDNRSGPNVTGKKIK